MSQQDVLDELYGSTTNALSTAEIAKRINKSTRNVNNILLILIKTGEAKKLKRGNTAFYWTTKKRGMRKGHKKTNGSPEVTQLERLFWRDTCQYRGGSFVRKMRKLEQSYLALGAAKRPQEREER